IRPVVRAHFDQIVFADSVDFKKVTNGFIDVVEDGDAGRRFAGRVKWHVLIEKGIVAGCRKVFTQRQQEEKIKVGGIAVNAHAIGQKAVSGEGITDLSSVYVRDLHDQAQHVTRKWRIDVTCGQGEQRLIAWSTV